MKVEDELGVLPPLGFWDPLGLAEDDAKFARRRAVEIKHGRIAMLACVGYLVPEVFKFDFVLVPNGDPIFGGGTLDGGLNTQDIPPGIGAFNYVPPLGWLQILFFIIAPVEIAIWPASDYTCDYGTGYFGRDLSSNPEELREKLNKELQNGRAAMLGIMGMMTQEVISGLHTGEQTKLLLSGQYNLPFGAHI